MPTQKKFPRPLLFIALCWLVAIFICAGFLIWYYLNQIMLPMEPEMSGDFPQTPTWIYTADNPVVSSPASDGSKIFIRTCCSVDAIETETGKLIWQIDSEAPYLIRENEIVLSPQVYGDILIFPEKGASIAAYSIIEGQLLWKTPQLDVNLKAPEIALIDNFIVKDGRLFVTRWSWSLSAYNLSTGGLIWETRVPDRVSLDIEVDSDCVYLSENTILRCYDPATGNYLWEKDFGAFIGPIKLNDNILFLAIYLDPKILGAMDLNQKKFNWTIQQNETTDIRLNRLLIADNRLYAVGERAYAFSIADGSIIWSSEHLGTSKQLGTLEQPTTFNGQIVVRNKDHDLFLLDSATGKVVGQMKVKHNISSIADPDRSPISAGNFLIVPFGDERVYSFR